MFSEVPYPWVTFCPQLRHSVFTEQNFEKEKTVKNVHKKPQFQGLNKISIQKVHPSPQYPWISIIKVRPSFVLDGKHGQIHDDIHWRCKGHNGLNNKLSVNFILWL
jgi:hypothetical protein